MAVEQIKFIPRPLKFGKFPPPKNVKGKCKMRGYNTRFNLPISMGNGNVRFLSPEKAEYEVFNGTFHRVG